MRFPDKPPLAPKHIEERTKLAASGLQALTLALLAAVVLAPKLNASLVAPLWAKVVAGAVAGLAELSAFVLPGYVPPTR